MKYLIMILSVINLTGCGTMYSVLEAHFDANDPCQRAGAPDFCGAAAGIQRATLRTPQGRVVGTVDYRR